MNLLSRRSVLAVAAVVDVALHCAKAPVAAKALAARHKLPPRHLETLLQGLVHAKILKGVRGPRGGYELARDRRRITVGEIVRTAMSLSTADPEDLGANSVLLERVIDPAVRKAGETFLANLDAITVEQMCETAEKSHVLDDEKVSGLLSDPGICELGVGRHGPFGSRRGRSQHRKPRTRTGDAGRAGGQVEGAREAGFIYTVVDTPPAITDAIRAVVALADFVLISVQPTRLAGCRANRGDRPRGRQDVLLRPDPAKGNALLTVQAMAALSEHGVVAQVC